MHNDAGVAGLLERPPTGRTVLSSSRQATSIPIIIVILKQCGMGELFYTYDMSQFVTLKDTNALWGGDGESHW